MQNDLEKIGQATPEERDEFKRLYNRKNALRELLLTLKEESLEGEQDEVMYKKVIKDLNETERKYRDLWRHTVEKYNGKMFWVKNGLFIQTCEIFLK